MPREAPVTSAMRSASRSQRYAFSALRLHVAVAITTLSWRALGKQAMAEMSSATAHGHRIRPVDVFVGGIVAVVLGIVAILGAVYVPSPGELAFGFRMCGFFFLAAGATAAALALLRADDAVRGGTDLHGRPAKSA